MFQYLLLGLLATAILSAPSVFAQVGPNGITPCEAYLTVASPRAHPSPISTDLTLQVNAAREYLPPARHVELGRFVAHAVALDPIHGQDWNKQVRLWKKHQKALNFDAQIVFEKVNRTAVLNNDWFSEPSARRILRNLGSGYPELAAPTYGQLERLANRLAAMQSHEPTTKVAKTVLISLLVAYARNRPEPWVREAMIDVWSIFRTKVPTFRQYPAFPIKAPGVGSEVRELDETQYYLELLRETSGSRITRRRSIDDFVSGDFTSFALSGAEIQAVEDFAKDVESVRDTWLDQVAIRSGIPKADLVDARPRLTAARAAAAAPEPRGASVLSRMSKWDERRQELERLQRSIDEIEEIPDEERHRFQGELAALRRAWGMDSVASAPPPPPPRTKIDLARAIDEAREKLGSLAKEYLSETVEPTPIVEKRPGAWGRLNDYFEAANKKLIEREHFLELARVTFLLDGSMLILGPPGTAKSMGVDLVGKSILDENGQRSYYSQQLSPDTMLSETSGGIIVDKAVAGETVRNWNAGAWGFAVVFLDEVFDGRLKFVSTFLSAFKSREYVQGHVREKAKTRIFFGATNKYIDQVFRDAQAEDHTYDPADMIDAFSTIYLATGKFENLSSVLRLNEIDDIEPPPISFADLDDLQANIARVPMTARQELLVHLLFEDMKGRVRAREKKEAAEVEQLRMRGEDAPIPYRSTRIYSPESLQRVFKRIRVIAFERARREGLDGVAVVDDDIYVALSQYLAMQGPSAAVVRRELESHPEDDERRQLRTLEFERGAISDTIAHYRNDEAADRKKTQEMTSLLATNGDMKPVIEWLGGMVRALEDLDVAKQLNSSHLTSLETLRGLIDSHPEFKKLVAP